MKKHMTLCTVFILALSMVAGIQAQETAEGWKEAPCSLVNSGVPFDGGTISWNEETKEWKYFCHSILAELTLGGTYDEDGVLNLVDDNIGFGSVFVPSIEPIFQDALQGVFQDPVEVTIYPDNELSESIMAVTEGDFNPLYQFAVAENARIYDPATHSGNTVFYGASNFWYWRTMEEDLAPYAVENHAFGGSADKDLYFWAPYILYPYNPCIVFFQTGSNDYVQSEAETDELKVVEAMEFKKKMFAEFHEKLPDAKFVVMSGLLLPGRAEYVDMTLDINDQLKAFCEENDYMYFVDAEAISYDREAGAFVDGVDSLFIEDGIHLTGDSRITWANNWIIPVLEELDAPKVG